MIPARSLLCLLLLLPAVTTRAQIVDNFSDQQWKLFSSTPGEIHAAAGKLQLVDSADEPDWVTASKSFRVDFSQTPIFLVQVSDVSDQGSVKLIRKAPYDKQTAVSMDRPGLYMVDMSKQFGWKGVGEVEVCLYANGNEEEITFGYVKFTAQLSAQEQASIRSRDAAGNVKLTVDKFEVVPSFSACSYYLPSTSADPVSVAYRQAEADWQPALPPPYFAEDSMFRGSIVGLAEDMAYEVRVTAESGKVLAQQKFTTWSSDVPIARTIVLDESKFTGQLTIRDKGSAEGWIKFTAAPGSVLQNDRTGPLLKLYRARYVILEGLTLRGGLQEVIALEKCEHVRVINCDIAGWGRIGQQRFDLDGKYYTERGSAINWDSAILVRRCTGTVIERCYIHDPLTTANPWYYSHPAGPQAVGIDKPTSTVVRYNDFIGSDQHRWNDSIEGAGNFHVDGGFNRDADIYGNLMCFANDDAVEIDGGQTNVRVYQNKLEGCLCGVSIQGCMSSPSYVFRNLLVNMGDENGVAGQTIKTSSYANGQSAVSFIFNNTCFGPSRDLNLPQNLRIVARNNIFAGRSAISGGSRSRQSDCDYNLLVAGPEGEESHGIVAPAGLVQPAAGLFQLDRGSAAIGHGVPLANFTVGEQGRVDMGAIAFGSDLILPLRPIPVLLDKYQLTFSAADSAAGRSDTVTASVAGETFSSPFTIAQNEAFDWFDVSPQQGTLQSGQQLAFTVTLRPEKMRSRPLYRGAFLVRLANGYSRPVMVYAGAEITPVIKPSRDGVWAQYLEAESVVAATATNAVSDSLASGGTCLRLARDTASGSLAYRFAVPQAGTYFVLMRIRSDAPVDEHDTVRFALDEGSLEEACLLTGPSWGWSLAGHNRQQRLTRLQAFKLEAGEHVLKLAPRDSIYIDLIAVTDNPGMFDD